MSPTVPIRILCVDDNRDAAEVIGTDPSSSCGLQAEAAFDGPSALRALERFRPHACVSDINMPGIDGCETVPPGPPVGRPRASCSWR